MDIQLRFFNHSYRHTQQRHSAQTLRLFGTNGRSSANSVFRFAKHNTLRRWESILLHVEKSFRSELLSVRDNARQDIDGRYRKRWLNGRWIGRRWRRNWRRRRIVHRFGNVVCRRTRHCRRRSCGGRRCCRVWRAVVVDHLFHLNDKVEIGPRVSVCSRLVKRRHKNVFFRALAFERFEGRRDQTLELVSVSTLLSVEEWDLVCVPRGHRVRSDVLHVRDQQVAVLGPAHLRRVDVLDQEAKQVSVPHVD